MFFFFFFKQKTAYELRISDWSSDVCSSDLNPCAAVAPPRRLCGSRAGLVVGAPGRAFPGLEQPGGAGPPPAHLTLRGRAPRQPTLDRRAPAPCPAPCAGAPTRGAAAGRAAGAARRRVDRRQMRVQGKSVYVRVSRVG